MIFPFKKIINTELIIDEMAARSKRRARIRNVTNPSDQRKWKPHVGEFVRTILSSVKNYCGI